MKGKRSKSLNYKKRSRPSRQSTYFKNKTNTTIDKSFVHNFSTTILNNNDYKLLSLGPNFIFSPPNSKIKDLRTSLKDFERKIRLRRLFGTHNNNNISSEDKILQVKNPSFWPDNSWSQNYNDNMEDYINDLSFNMELEFNLLEQNKKYNIINIQNII